MEPIFTLPYSEYVVAQRLATVLHSAQGFSLHAPLSRQEKGVDLVVTLRTGGLTRAATLQVKASRTYSRPRPHPARHTTTPSTPGSMCSLCQSRPTL